MKKATYATTPRNLYFACFIIFLLFWACSAIRHGLLQSNAYDLGLFDQWVWLASQRLDPISSMEGVHLLADHGAWTLYAAALLYRFFPSVQWLLASQAAALAFTALPIWLVGAQASLSQRFCWLACGLWWLQPVVFNVNLFDFHPEVWVMPALALSYWASRASKPWIWFLLLLLLLGARDGLILVIAGLGLEQLARKRWIWAGAAIGLAFAWLAFLNRGLYPWLTGSTRGPKAVAGLFSYLGDSFDEVFLNLLTKPYLVFANIDWIAAGFYLILITIPIALFFRKVSVPVLCGSIPLVIVNLMSEEAPQRTLIHHYSLPIAVIVVIAAIDSMAARPLQRIPWVKLAWSALCWAALAKPWFFTGPYLSRLDLINTSKNAISTITQSTKILTTSYLVPHLSQRQIISFPKDSSTDIVLNDLDLILLNPLDPGWGSNKQYQEMLLLKARAEGWDCRSWENGLEMCKRASSQ